MEKKDIVTKYNDAIETYNELADLVEKVYNKLKKLDSIKMGKKELLNNFDLYVQSLLIITAFGDKKVLQVEMEFLKKITRYHDQYEKYDSDEIVNDGTKLNEIKEEASKTLECVPYFIQMCAACDKQITDDKENTYSKRVFKLLLEIIFTLSDIDGEVTEDEIKDATKALEPVACYLKVNEIEFI